MSDRIPSWSGMHIPASALEKLLNQVALETGVTPKELLGAGRCRRVAHARQYAMWKLRQVRNGEHAKYPLAEIGRVFKRDHATVIFAIRRVEKRLEKQAFGVAA